MGGSVSTPTVVFEINDSLASISFGLAAARVSLRQKVSEPAVIVAANLLRQLNEDHFAALAKFFGAPYEPGVSGGVIKIANSWVALAEFSLAAAEEQSIVEAVRAACRRVFERPPTPADEPEEPELVDA
jgi:hypothetical protein